MKNNLQAIALLLLLFSLNIQAQTTYSGNLIFNSQADLDSFPSNYINVTGNLYIQNSDITDLTPLNNIQSIGSDLVISGNSSLTTFDGLNNLISIGDDLKISSNSNLTSISGLNNLTKVAGYFNIQFNFNLTSISGFAKLNSVHDYFKLYYNEKLNSISGFNSLSYFGDDVDIYRCSLIPSFQMFSGVTSIGGSLSLEYNNVVTSLRGFENLLAVGGFLSLENLNRVTDFDELSNLTSVGRGVTISENSVLTNINGLSNISFSSSPTINIRFNKELTSLAPLNFLSGTIRNLTLQSNDKISDLLPFIGVTNIQYQLVVSEKSITTLNGFENITYIGDDLEISSCDELVSTSALSNVTMFGGDINIRFNKKLADLSLLTQLSDASGDIELFANDVLSDLSPLSNLTIIGAEFYIRDNALTSLSGLENLTSVGTDLTLLVNRKMENIEALSNLQSVGKRLRIISNNELISLDGLDSLTNVSNNVEIYSNEKLEDVNALGGLENVGGSFSIYANEALDECCILLDFINSNGIVGGEVSIYNNSENCNSTTIISNLCDDLDGDGVTGAEGDCDNYNAHVFPGNIEICDGIDNDCNGLIDGNDPNVVGQNIWYEDTDLDGLGDPNSSILSCNQPDGYVDNNLDNCIDTINSDQEDDDCDGVGNTCDLCPTGDDKQDSDGDGIPDCAEWEVVGDHDEIDSDDIEWGTFEDLPSNFICGNNDNKILVCRVKKRPNRPTKYKTKCVRPNKVSKVLEKGGFLGACEVVSCTEGGQGYSVDGKNEIAVGKIRTTPIVNFQNEMTLFPNPALHEVSIFIKKSNLAVNVGTGAIVCSTGQIVKNLGEINLEQTIQVDLSQMKKGIYFVVVRIENQEPLVQRLVIMK